MPAPESTKSPSESRGNLWKGCWSNAGRAREAEGEQPRHRNIKNRSMGFYRSTSQDIYYYRPQLAWRAHIPAALTQYSKCIVTVAEWILCAEQMSSSRQGFCDCITLCFHQLYIIPHYRGRCSRRHAVAKWDPARLRHRKQTLGEPGYLLGHGDAGTTSSPQITLSPCYLLMSLNTPFPILTELGSFFSHLKNSYYEIFQIV